MDVFPAYTFDLSFNELVPADIPHPSFSNVINQPFLLYLIPSY